MFVSFFFWGGEGSGVGGLPYQYGRSTCSRGGKQKKSETARIGEIRGRYGALSGKDSRRFMRMHVLDSVSYRAGTAFMAEVPSYRV